MNDSTKYSDADRLQAELLAAIERLPGITLAEIHAKAEFQDVAQVNEALRLLFKAGKIQYKPSLVVGGTPHHYLTGTIDEVFNVDKWYLDMDEQEDDPNA